MSNPINQTTLEPLQTWISAVEGITDLIDTPLMKKELDQFQGMIFSSSKEAKESFSELATKWDSRMCSLDMDGDVSLTDAVDDVVKKLVFSKNSTPPLPCAATKAPTLQPLLAAPDLHLDCTALIKDIEETTKTLEKLNLEKENAPDREAQELHIINTARDLDDLRDLLSRRRGVFSPKPKGIVPNQAPSLKDIYLDEIVLPTAVSRRLENCSLMQPKEKIGEPFTAASSPQAKKMPPQNAALHKIIDEIERDWLTLLQEQDSGIVTDPEAYKIVESGTHSMLLDLQELLRLREQHLISQNQPLPVSAPFQPLVEEPTSHKRQALRPLDILDLSPLSLNPSSTSSTCTAPPKYP